MGEGQGSIKLNRYICCKLETYCSLLTHPNVTALFVLAIRPSRNTNERHRIRERPRGEERVCTGRCTCLENMESFHPCNSTSHRFASRLQVLAACYLKRATT